MTESNTEKFKRISNTFPGDWSREDAEFMVDLAEERVMIEEYDIGTLKHNDGWSAWTRDENSNNEASVAADLSTALRSVAAKIGEGK